jgi:hypothetical protein
MNDSLVDNNLIKDNKEQINKLEFRLRAIKIEQNNLRAKRDQFETAGKGFSIPGTIEQFARISNALDGLIERGNVEIDSLTRKIEALK